MSGWIFHVDSRGRRIKPAPREMVGYTIVPVNPTPPHALSSPGQVSAREEDALEEGRYARLRAAAKLSPLEDTVLELQERKHKVTRTRTVAISELEELLDAGWVLVSKRNGRAKVARDFVDAKHTYAEIAERLDLTERQVARVVSHARRKLRAVGAGR